MNAQEQRPAVAHVRYDGRSVDVPLSQLDLSARAADVEIKRALARHLNASEAQLRGHIVDRHQNGNVTVRPEAVFG